MSSCLQMESLQPVIQGMHRAVATITITNKTNLYFSFTQHQGPVQAKEDPLQPGTSYNKQGQSHCSLTAAKERKMPRMGRPRRTASARVIISVAAAPSVTCKRHAEPRWSAINKQLAVLRKSTPFDGI
jgi:hypothetical protein